MYGANEQNIDSLLLYSSKEKQNFLNSEHGKLRLDG